MILYNLIVENSNLLNKKGCIWCTDGSFIKPKNFSRSGREAYGYCLDNDTAVRLTRNSIKVEWSNIDKNLYCSTGSISRSDGFSNSEVLRSIDEFSRSKGHAIYECLDQSNAGIKSYMPAIEELSELYKSIMYGDMNEDLRTAGIYELCNYRLSARKLGSYSYWGEVWSSTESTDEKMSDYIYCVFSNGKIYPCYKSHKRRDKGYYIPFFRI